MRMTLRHYVCSTRRKSRRCPGKSKSPFSYGACWPGKWPWVDSNGTDGKPTFHRRANLSWVSKICNHFWSPVYTIQLAVKTVWQPVWQTRFYDRVEWTATFHSTRLWNRSYNPVWQPFDNRLYTRYSRFVKPAVKPVVKPVSQPVWQPAVLCIQTFNGLSNRFDNRLDVCLHDTADCQTGCTTGCIV